MTNTDIGARLKTLRKGRKLTQQELADKMGVTRCTVSNYETGRRSPHISELKRFAEFFGTDLSFFGYAEASKDEVFDLLSRAKDIFASDKVSHDTKKEIFDELMKLYLRVK